MSLEYLHVVFVPVFRPLRNGDFELILDGVLNDGVHKRDLAFIEPAYTTETLDSLAFLLGCNSLSLLCSVCFLSLLFQSSTQLPFPEITLYDFRAVFLRQLDPSFEQFTFAHPQPQFLKHVLINIDT